MIVQTDDWTGVERYPNARIRAERLKEARVHGRHTWEQFQALKDEFDRRCVKCGTRHFPVERDHIVPVYMGGRDTIDNIQPLCAYCNSSKKSDSFNWAEYRRKHGFQGLPI